MTDTTRYTVTVFKDAQKTWRWATFAGNGEQVASSSEGYASKAHALEQAEALNPGMDVRVEE